MKDLSEFNQELGKKNLGGYWETVPEVDREPSSFEPYLWKWNDVYEAIVKAGEVVGLESSSRRVIQLRNPSLNRVASPTLQLNVQMLKPGEHAPAHRHTLGGIRFVIKGNGARCVVAGEAFEIGEGDLVTTPSWAWHDHINDSDQTLFWLDGLDAPLVRLLLPEIGFFEPLKDKDKRKIGSRSAQGSQELGPIRPSWVRTDAAQPPQYCYRWEDTARVLKSVGERPGDPADGILLQYVNPLTGGPTLTTMSCAIQMLRPGEKTRSHRHVSSALYHVYRGRGTTVIGDRRYEWETGDSFVVPLWRFHRHENVSEKEALLFVMTDRPAMEALGFYREEVEDRP